MSFVRNDGVAYTVIESAHEGQRIDNFLLRICKGVPKSHVYRILRNGEVRVNSGRVDAAYRLVLGDRIRIPPLRLALPSASAEGQEPTRSARAVPLPIVFEDNSLLAIDKPAGLAVHGGSGISAGVIEALRAERAPEDFLELVHRLDRETSGVLLVAKKRAALRGLQDQFREGRIDKHYLVLVRGTWREPIRHVRLPLFKYLDAEGERRVRVDGESGRAAHTVFRVLRTGTRFSLLDAQLKTGRTHQIRVHLAHLGFPIVGDDKYGDFTLNRLVQRQGLKRMFLHAWRLRLTHPASGEAIHLEAGLPAALTGFIDYLTTRGELPRGKTI